ncbi:MAG TPA: hypothetical protein VF846_12190 [Thermoanaerobaculia bacterium]|jgi:hypothetical protein
MTVLGAVTLVGLIAAAALVVVYLRLRQKDVLDGLVTKYRASAALVSRASYVEGAENLPVVIALSDKSFFYENADLEASFDLDRLDEIEYDDDLTTGRAHSAGCRVLRLRSHGAAFEFLLDKNDCSKWASALPPRSYGRTTAQAV